MFKSIARRLPAGQLEIVCKVAVSVALCFLAAYPGHCAPARNAAAQKKGAAATQTSAASEKSLSRVDWQVTGSSCASCLIRLERKLRGTPGVLKVVVSIYKPFKAALIYNKAETTWPKIGAAMEAEKVGAANLKEATIKDLPLVLEPR